MEVCAETFTETGFLIVSGKDNYGLKLNISKESILYQASMSLFIHNILHCSSYTDCLSPTRLNFMTT